MRKKTVAAAVAGLMMAASAVGGTALAGAAGAATPHVVASEVSGQWQYVAPLGATQINIPNWLRFIGVGVADTVGGTGIVNVNCDLPGNGQDSLVLGQGNNAGGCGLAGAANFSLNCRVVYVRVGAVAVLTGSCDWPDATVPMHGVLVWEPSSFDSANVGGAIVMGTPV
ncbi:MAG: hypothetical protein QOI20_544 [Acidimicrobiaceae bacterium]|jgi:hypothetical protein|nr:hypothetical protein [Acidimicrobiaceae bacterium]